MFSPSLQAVQVLVTDKMKASSKPRLSTLIALLIFAGHLDLAESANGTVCEECNFVSMPIDLQAMVKDCKSMASDFSSEYGQALDDFEATCDGDIACIEAVGRDRASLEKFNDFANTTMARMEVYACMLSSIEGPEPMREVCPWGQTNFAERLLQMGDIVIVRERSKLIIVFASLPSTTSIGIILMSD